MTLIQPLIPEDEELRNKLLDHLIEAPVPGNEWSINVIMQLIKQRDQQKELEWRLPVPYTLQMKGNGDFEAIWEPASPTAGVPPKLFGESSSSALKAIARLRDKLVEFGVIEATSDPQKGK